MRFSQKGGLFFYTISDGPAGADCDYSYYNATDHVIANNYDKEPSLVLNSSLDGLVAFKCIEHLFFKATCGKGEFYSANVTGSSDQTVPAVASVVVLVSWLWSW
ncbi:hypothetical protein D4764_0247750 [Takifugu flavidus]|uniref:Uncharacterized protein n=1 Tax=Takifugu flavidus TaxID=433684 RepID=A0A5C6MG95_9TELE|nr:hypothetical protein D4764_0247750 [Takifugu flavidus]